MKRLFFGAALAVAVIAGLCAIAALSPDLAQAMHVVQAGLMLPVAGARPRGLLAARLDNDPAKIFAELRRAFDEFKAAREEEIKGITARFDDVVTRDKVERINEEIAALNKALNEANLSIAAMTVGGAGGGNRHDPDVIEHAQAFDRWFRRGIDNGLSELEVKAKLTTQSDPDGGFLVPEETEDTIDRILGTVSAIRSLARVMQISTDTFKKLVSMGGAGAGWVGEEDERPETATPSLREIVINTGEIYANPIATQQLLDDARIDIAAWLGDEVSTTFGEQESAAFVAGNGVKKPRGILSYDAVPNADYAWGKLGYVATGDAAGFQSTTTEVNPADCLIDLYYGLKAAYRQNAAWLMSDKVMNTVRKWKDADGSYIWAPPSDSAAVSTILGKPVHTDDNMPAVGANAFPIAFGDFGRAYLIVDRFGIRVLRDPYTRKPYVQFYTTKRVGGGIVNFEALKLLKVAAS